MSRERLTWPLIYGSVLVAALVVRRASFLEGFWIDEVMSAAIIADPWDLMLTRIGFTDVHPPAYYMALKCWSLLVGNGDAALRSLSMLASVATIALVMRWAQEKAKPASVLFVGMLLAASPFHIHYSVEVRSYALFTWAALSLAFLVTRWQRSPGRGMALLITFEVLTLSLHYYGLIWVALINLYMLLSEVERPRRLAWFKGQCLALALFSLWLPLLFVQLFELPELMKAHLSDALPFTRVIASLGPLQSFSLNGAAFACGALVLLLAVVGAWRTLNQEEGGGEQAHALVTWPRMQLILLSIVFLFSPCVPLVVLPMSDALLAAYMRQLPFAYVAIVAALGLGALFWLKPPRRLRLPLSTWLMLAGPLLVLVMHQVQPMLFLRNLLIFLPLIYLSAGLAMNAVPSSLTLGVSVIVLILGASVSGKGSEVFMPRQDFKAVAQALAHEEPEVTVLVAPAWDAPGVRRYAPAFEPRGVMAAQDVAAMSQETSTLAVLLSRPERHALSQEGLEEALGPRWRLSEARSLRGHRGPMRWLFYRAADAAESP